MKNNREISKRMVDAAAYIDALRSLVEEGKTVGFLVTGSSMSPFLIHQRDRVFLEKPTRPFRVGDIVFYQRDNGRYIMHRIYKMKEEGLYIVGDAQTEIEGPVRLDQVFAVIRKCERKGKMITSGDFWWDFFEKVWIRILPLRPLIRGSYEKTVSLFRR